MARVHELLVGRTYDVTWIIGHKTNRTTFKVTGTTMTDPFLFFDGESTKKVDGRTILVRIPWDAIVASTMKPYEDEDGDTVISESETPIDEAFKREVEGKRLANALDLIDESEISEESERLLEQD